MSMSSSPPEHDRSSHGSIATRRGFIAGASLGALSLYGLWVAYGTAPLGLDGTETVHAASPHGGGHGAGHETPPALSGDAGHGAATGPSAEEFRSRAQDFIERHRLADGSVEPDSEPISSSGGAMAGHSQATGGQHRMPGNGATAMGAHGGATAAPADALVDVYLLAQQWTFDPAVLRLKLGKPYRLRMMAVDVSHGASLQLGPGSQIIRLRPGIIDDRLVAFTRAGEYLIYCTVYCGVGHDHMSAKLIVA